jgi:hypothetical protein
MEPVAPNVDELAWRRVINGVNCARNGLRDQPGQQQRHEEHTADAQQAQETLFDGPSWT